MSNTFATNAASNSAVSYLHRNSAWQSSSIAKLSSGSRIVKASDDAASLAVGTKIKADVTALKQAQTNATQASSLMQIADGAMSRIGDTLMRMKSLATQARSDVLSDTERGFLDAEYQKMLTQVDYIATSTKFNGTQVIGGGLGSTTGTVGEINTDAALANSGATSRLNAEGQVAGWYTVAYAEGTGTLTVTSKDSSGGNTLQTGAVVLDKADTDFSGVVTFENMEFSLSFTDVDLSQALTGGEVVVAGNAAKFQVGVTAGTDDISVNIQQVSQTTLGINGTDLKTIGDAANGAQQASAALDTAIQTINTRRADLGASMSRVEKINENLATTIENLDAARSTLLDVDVAEEMTKFTTNQVMTQAATAMLAQANQLPQNLMRLLQ